MNAHIAREIVDVITALSRLGETNVTWKWFSVPDGELIGRSVSLHCNSFCDAVKACGYGKRCARDDIFAFANRGDVPTRPHLKHCHAGVTELVVPIMRNRECAGLFYAGPWRFRRKRCTYPGAEDAWRRLGYHDPGLAGALGRALHFLARRLGADSASLMGPSPRVSHAGEPMEVAIRYIDEHCAEHVTVADVAQMCCLSPSRLMHVFKEKLGRTFTAVLTERRLARARNLLAHSELPVGAVGRQCGYPNQDYFSTVFRKVHGCAPREYRRRALERIDS